jgi:hypothetical protein
VAERKNIVSRADNLVLAKDTNGRRNTSGRFITDLLTLPPDCEFRTLQFTGDIPTETLLFADILDVEQRPLKMQVSSGTDLRIDRPIRLAFQFSTTDPQKTPRLDFYRLSFDRR